MIEFGGVAAKPAAAAAETDSVLGEAEEPPPISFEHLRRYTFGDTNLEREVLELFCKHAPSMMAELKRAASEKAWRDAAHSLKGSALAVGAWDVARSAEEAECAGARYIASDDLIARLELALGKVQRFVAARQTQP